MLLSQSRNQNVKSVSLAALILTLVLGAVPSNGAAADAEIERLRAFTKLYGYVRYFHPTDAAAYANWINLAVEGATRVPEAQNPGELEDILYDIFLPIAPTLRLTRGKPAPAAKNSGAPDSADIVAWQHLGMAMGRVRSYAYANIRTNKLNQMEMATDQYIEDDFSAIEHQGRELRLRAAASAVVGGPDRYAGLYVMVDRPNYQYGFTDFMEDRPITDSNWNVYEIVGEISEDAIRVYFGGYLNGLGAAWFDAFEFSVRDPGGPWEPVAISNPGFEHDSEFFGWYLSGFGLAASEDDSRVYEETRSAKILNLPGMPAKLFDALPEPGEMILADLGYSLSCELPLTVVRRDPPTDQPETHDKSGASDLGVSKATTQACRIAVVVAAWNVLQHFYPYFDVVDVDWDAELTKALEGAIGATTNDEFNHTVKAMVAALDDGHGHAVQNFDYFKGWLPVLTAWIDPDVVVTVSGVAELERGDRIISVDGVPAAEVMEDREQYISGSPQWKRYQSLIRFGLAEQDTTALVTIERDGVFSDLEVDRKRLDYLVEPRPNQIAELSPGVYYVDLDRASMGAIAAEIDDLAAASAVIFDVRGYPNMNHKVLCHLSDELLNSARWNVPQIIYPDQERIGWDTSGRWVLEPCLPRFSGHIVFLTDARAISYAETVMGIVEHYQLGDIVGRPTAGANGNTSSHQILGSTFVWSGMKVLKHDGSQHHIIGIQPTLEVQRTLAGVRAGLDEDLEAALDLISDPTR